jgi:hypothetical protein
MDGSVACCSFRSSCCAGAATIQSARARQHNHRRRSQASSAAAMPQESSTSVQPESCRPELACVQRHTCCITQCHVPSAPGPELHGAGCQLARRSLQIASIVATIDAACVWKHAACRCGHQRLKQISRTQGLARLPRKQQKQRRIELQAGKPVSHVRRRVMQQRGVLFALCSKRGVDVAARAATGQLGLFVCLAPIAGCYGPRSCIWCPVCAAGSLATSSSHAAAADCEGVFVYCCLHAAYSVALGPCLAARCLQVLPMQRPFLCSDVYGACQWRQSRMLCRRRRCGTAHRQSRGRLWLSHCSKCCTRCKTVSCLEPAALPLAACGNMLVLHQKQPELEFYNCRYAHARQPCICPCCNKRAVSDLACLSS